MLSNSTQITVLGLTGLLLGLSFALPIQAETCSALKVIGANGTKVQKTVSPISTLVTNNNWNTDFAVTGGRSFNRYVATIIPENNANYDVKLNLKYSDNSSTEVDKRDNVAVKVRQPLRLEGIPRSQGEPFQVNVFVGGINAIGNTYTVSVAGCN
ncbi:hypothetical protein Syn7502_02051 [Synechococcus sp. PCC 7502]|uniref:hypothetical protein n=1 Tax=Synechococcus sp. PCC 7502 TaxID=1173263 RepID=UPI00029FA375|nr:hypothetical protein [Synechococcus sp. PCC 7502]AFY74073.1 hypothetical protein Syn7502_02051 [Synechococcus sp. PCC 7502]